MKKLFVSAFVLLSVVLFCGGAIGQNVSRMTKEDLRAMLRNPDVFVIDVRLPQEWAGSEKKIRGAIREDPLAVDSWMSNFPKEKTLVFYCS